MVIWSVDKVNTQYTRIEWTNRKNDHQEQSEWNRLLKMLISEPYLKEHTWIAIYRLNSNDITTSASNSLN